MLDVAVHADGAAVDEAPHAGGGGGLDQLSNRRGVDLVIHALGQAGLAVQRGDVVDDLEAVAESRRQRFRLREIARDQWDVVPGRCVAPCGSRTIAHTSWPRCFKRAREMSAGESGGAGDEDLHRSATTVTGDPSSRINPMRDIVPSIRRVHASEFTRLCSAIGRTNCRCSPVTRNPAAASAHDTAPGENTR